MIEIQGVAKTFRSGARTTVALGEVDLRIGDGEFVSFIGPSGCGKSTLLNMIAGIIAPSAGSILHDGRTVTGPNTATGYMTQQESLLPWRTAAANIGLPLLLRKRPQAEIDARVTEMLALVGLKNFGGHFPGELSGGMKKRIALAQILSYDPATLLMDEPFGALDAQLKLLMQAELLRIWEGAKKTIVFVTHDLAEAITMSDRVVVFSSRPGRIKAIEAIDLPRPRDPLKIQFEPAYQAIHRRLWALLAPEIEASRAEAFA
jgi:NitT/TauT family transport system ATP-binding protein